MQKSVPKIRERTVIVFHPMLPELVVQPPRFTAVLHFTSTESKMLQLLLVHVSRHSNTSTVPEESKEESIYFVCSWVLLQGMNSKARGLSGGKLEGILLQPKN